MKIIDSPPIPMSSSLGKLSDSKHIFSLLESTLSPNTTL